MFRNRIIVTITNSFINNDTNHNYMFINNKTYNIPDSFNLMVVYGIEFGNPLG